MASEINNAILKVSRRAEANDRAYLANTFVDVGPLFTLLSNRDHQILYGRRGTGKTHILSYLADSVESNEDIAIQIDMRTVGSSGGIYSDPAIMVTERATSTV
jgi:Cdc6-like AAA superfamily ATPase